LKQDWRKARGDNLVAHFVAETVAEMPAESIDNAVLLTLTEVETKLLCGKEYELPYQTNCDASVQPCSKTSGCGQHVKKMACK
jgi:hypothetical protein